MFRDLRGRRQHAVNEGTWPAFSAATEAARQSDWQVAAPLNAEPKPQILLSGLECAQEAQTLAGQALAEGDRLVLRIDSLWGAIELEAIVHALRDYVVMLDCDYDAYLYSFICTFQRYPRCILPDREDMTSKTHLLGALARHVISVGARRGVRVQGDGVADKSSTFLDGQPVEVADLVQVPRGRITRLGMCRNLRKVLEPDVGSTTVKLACAQLWQWVRHETGVLDEGPIITTELFDELDL